VQRLVFALVNEAAHILEEGIASRASDIDMVYLTGYGFPMHRGGPMQYADQVGLFNVVQAMKRFQKTRERRCEVLGAGAADQEAGGRRQGLQRLICMIKRVLLILLALVALLVAAVAINTCARARARSACRQRRRWRWTRRARPSGWAGPSGCAPSPAVRTPTRTPPSSASCTTTCSSATRRTHATLQARAGGRPEPALHLARHRPPGQAHPADGAPGRGARAPGTESNWEVPPFSGEVKGGYVWGRGAWDDKGNLIAQMEAVEMLVASRLPAAPDHLLRLRP
jgi:hypothetical protein